MNEADGVHFLVYNDRGESKMKRIFSLEALYLVVYTKPWLGYRKDSL